MFNKLKTSGETLVEVLVSVGILTTCLTVVFVMIDRSMTDVQDIRMRVTATELAREGIEGVRNIRDTNWIKYSGVRRDAWLCGEDDNANGICDSGEKLSSDDYFLDYDTTSKNYTLEAGSTDEDYRLYQTGSGTFEDLYTHDSATGNIKTNFFRKITLNIQNPYKAGSEPNFCDTSGVHDSCINGRAYVTSEVWWNEDNVDRKLVLDTYMFDFYGRDAY